MKSLKKRKSRQLTAEEFREAFGFKQNPITRAQVPLVIPTRRIIPDKSVADSGSWTSKDELGSRDELSSQSLDDPSRGSGDRRFESVETCSSGVGSDYSERHPTSNDLHIVDIPLEAQLQINRRASRYRPIRVNIQASSHVSQVHAGYLQHRVGRRKWTQLWCVAVERLLYLYESVTADVTVDVVNLNDYTLIAELLQPSRNKFRLKISHTEAETHEFYTTTSDAFYLWFATFDRLTSSGSARLNQKTSTVEAKIEHNRLSQKTIKPFDILGDMKQLEHSPRALEKEKIQEQHRRLEVESAMYVQGKLTRLTQRRHSISQKIQSLNRTGLDPTKSRRFRLQNDLACVNKDIEDTIMSSKSSMSQIAASRERELSRKRLIKVESVDEAVEDVPTTIMTPCSRPASTTPTSKRSLPRPLKKIRSFARSLSRSTSNSSNRAQQECGSMCSRTSYKSIDCGMAMQISTTSMQSEKDLARKKNLAKLDPDTLAEIEKFDQLALEFESFSPPTSTMNDSNNDSTTASDEADLPFRENLI